MSAISKSEFSLPKKVLGLLGFQGVCVFIALLVLWILMWLLSPIFMTERNTQNILRQASCIAIIAAGISLVVFVGGIDLSVGSVLALSGFIGGLALLKTQSAALSIVVSLAFGCAAGFLSGWVVALLRIPLESVGIRIGNRELSPFFIPSLVVTFIMLIFARGCTYVVSEGLPKGINTLPTSYAWLNGGIIGTISNSFVIAVLFFVILAIILREPRIDHFINAAANSNRDASRLSRIESGLTTIVAFMFCGGCAGLASIIVTARVHALLPQIGEGYALDAIAATLIGGASIYGGKGHIVATLVGGLLVATVNNGMDLLSFSGSYRSTAMVIIIIVAVAVDLMRKRRLAKPV